MGEYSVHLPLCSGYFPQQEAKTSLRESTGSPEFMFGHELEFLITTLHSGFLS